MDASCGPSSALSQLSKHTQRDTSLQHERHHQAPNQLPAFRSHLTVDASLNQDFHRFSQSGPSGFEAHTFGPSFGQNQGMQAAQRLEGNMGRNHEWIHDFNGLSLRERQSQNQNQALNQGLNHGKSDWHLQFMKMNQAQSQQNVQQSQQFQQLHNQLQYGQMGGLGMNRLSQMNTQYAQQFQNHDVLDSMKEDSMKVDDQFAERFDALEREIAEQQTEKAEFSDDLEKEQFAEAARQVKSLMTRKVAGHSEETASKFQQSDFLKLMLSISDREVEISENGDKLVTKNSGTDIREHLSDPLRDVRGESLSHERTISEALRGEAPSGLPANLQPSHIPQPPTQRESDAVRGHLPDPLAHIKDGDLNGDLSSLQAAQVISGGQVNSENWMEDGAWSQFGRRTGRMPSLLSPMEQEVYDDYRQDDY